MWLPFGEKPYLQRALWKLELRQLQEVSRRHWLEAGEDVSETEIGVGGAVTEEEAVVVLREGGDK